jgi:hypothetical protein
MHKIGKSLKLQQFVPSLNSTSAQLTELEPLGERKYFSFGSVFYSRFINTFVSTDQLPMFETHHHILPYLLCLYSFQTSISVPNGSRILNPGDVLLTTCTYNNPYRLGSSEDERDSFISSLLIIFQMHCSRSKEIASLTAYYPYRKSS